MATHSSILAWRIPRTEKPGGLQSMGSQRVGHNWATNTHTHTHTHTQELLRVNGLRKEREKGKTAGGNGSLQHGKGSEVWESTEHPWNQESPQISYLYSDLREEDCIFVQLHLEIYSCNQNQVTGNARRKCGRSQLCLQLVLKDVWLCTQEGTLRLKQPVEWMPSPSPSSWAQLRRILLTFLEWWLGSLALGSRSHLKVLSVSGWPRPLLPAKEGFLLCPYLKQYWQQWLEWE